MTRTTERALRGETERALRGEIEALRPSLVAMRRDLHRHPETAFQERRTAGILADHLARLGLEVQRGVGSETGVVGRLRGMAPGRTVMVRADIDALPILEATGAEYASVNPGAMHACGHDGHAAVAAHVATLLAKRRGELAGELRFVFQPAEEVVAGARPMVDAGVLDGVDAVVGLHLDNSRPAGQVAVRAGPSMAAPDAFTVVVTGRGGHAALPHQTVDPVVVSAQLVLALQSLVSRETDPVGTSVVSITTVRAGDGAHNIIPDTVELKGTLRTFDPELRAYLRSRIEEVATGLCSALRAEASLSWSYGPPPVDNDAALTERFRGLALGIVGPENVVEAQRVMGGDDMAEFLARRPGVYFWVGSSDPAAGKDRPHHHCGFDFDDERTLPVATELLAATALDFLRG